MPCRKAETPAGERAKKVHRASAWNASAAALLTRARRLRSRSTPRLRLALGSAPTSYLNRPQRRSSFSTPAGSTATWKPARCATWACTPRCGPAKPRRPSWHAPRASSSPAARAASTIPAAPPSIPPSSLRGQPVLGICYGQQLMAHLLGGEVLQGEKGEYGLATLDLDDAADPLFAGLAGRQQIWMSHRDVVGALPAGLLRGRPHRHLRRGRHRRAGAQALRRAVSSRSGAHRARPRIPVEFRVPRLRLRARIGTRAIAFR